MPLEIVRTGETACGPYTVTVLFPPLATYKKPLRAGVGTTCGACAAFAPANADVTTGGAPPAQPANAASAK